MKIPRQKVQSFQRKVLRWYKQHGRDLPWRATRDPYRILVSEVMLQQTQVSRVLPKYLAFIERYPTFAALAQARRRTLLALWSGLGYNSRALRLQQAAQEVVTYYGGALPKDPVLLLQLPGVGPYTAGAIQVFAWNKDVATIDTNIRRILLHELKLPQTMREKELATIAEACLPRGRSREWHNALMDYGALVLTSARTGIRPTSRQSAFTNSRRYYRGRILAHLLDVRRVSVTSIQERYEDAPFPVLAIVADLVREGLIQRRGDTLSV